MLKNVRRPAILIVAAALSVNAAVAQGSDALGKMSLEQLNGYIQECYKNAKWSDAEPAFVRVIRLLESQKAPERALALAHKNHAYLLAKLGRKDDARQELMLSQAADRPSPEKMLIEMAEQEDKQLGTEQPAAEPARSSPKPFAAAEDELAKAKALAEGYYARGQALWQQVLDASDYANMTHNWTVYQARLAQYEGFVHSYPYRSALQADPDFYEENGGFRRR